MNAVLQTPERLLLSLTTEELCGISNAMNEVCHGVHIDDEEFEPRLGVTREFLADLLHRLHAGAVDPLQVYQRTEAWADGASVQALCVTAAGDPVDLCCDEALRFVQQIHDAIEQAS